MTLKIAYKSKSLFSIIVIYRKPQSKYLKIYRYLANNFGTKVNLSLFPLQL